MYRLLTEKLIKWKNSLHRKPLILNGVRQVGKTWLLKDFGNNNYENTVYVNFDSDINMKTIFETDLDCDRIIAALEIFADQKIIPSETLIIFDEIQECPRALTSLKYFCENAPEYHIATAGSLLGLTIHSGTGFPVGKVNMLELYPLTFEEFLHATNNEKLCDIFYSHDTLLVNAFAEKLTSLLRLYYFVGGMPEAVSCYAQGGLLDDVRTIQKEILTAYERDISKHLNRTESEYAIAAFRSIPNHLSRENKKFIFGNIAESARARNYKAGISWLNMAGITSQVQRVSKPEIPLSTYYDDNGFKLFLVDVGLLAAMTGLDNKSILKGNDVFKEFKGALTEQYVCQELIAINESVPFYWSSRKSSGEIDFLFQRDSALFAIEVKAEQNLHSKSLNAFKKANPDVCAVRFSMSNYKEQSWMKNVPLWAISNLNLWT